MEANFQAVRKAGGDVDAQLDLMRQKTRGLADAADYAGESFKDLTSILQANLAELQKSESPLKLSLKARKGIRDISKELLYDEQGISALSEKQLTTSIEKLKISKESMKMAAEDLENQYGLQKVGDDFLQNAIERAKVRELGTNASKKDLEVANQQAINEADLIRAKREGFAVETGLLKKAEDRLGVQQSINKSMGLTGDAIKSAAGFMGKLGLSSKILGDATEEATKAMEDYAKANQKVDAKKCR